MKIKLVLFKPNIPRFDILNSYLEVIESLHWGFNNLGFECSFSVNEIDNKCINIVFGWIPALLNGNEFPEGTILYNLEQFSRQSMRGDIVLEKAAAQYQIWDYSISNISRWNEINPRFPAYYAPISFAPNLIKIPKVTEDIDILYIGSLGPKRAEKLISVSSSLNRNSVVSLANIWGNQRDEFISRSKILLNISNENSTMTIFEIVRVSYYLANKKAVICEIYPELEIENDMKNILKFVDSANLSSTCDEFISDARKREDYAEACFEAFRQRDVKDVINSFLN